MNIGKCYVVDGEPMVYRGRHFASHKHMFDGCDSEIDAVFLNDNQVKDLEEVTLVEIECDTCDRSFSQSSLHLDKRECEDCYMHRTRGK